ncbi:mitochondrial substrate carrier protein [Pochonia chlamydosporia 170]|uniref:Mitochondrial substrate carrier protein n=1 Tax=Pochonia chlamydosporia 170 TaxID=1380566 RepID=A0A179FNI8_METCM|nr:mitochondrial substrate carrier protein [Pochonia chlamydosporia 170]OAQ66579.1 mitochondrial substrate carrier protein [Pochonia chlamydosporia 170]
MTSRTTFTDHKDTYQAALISLFSGKPEDTEQDLSKLLAPNFTQRDEDGTRDFAAIVAHMRWLRENVPNVTLTITRFLRDGSQIADMHIGLTTLEDGTVLKSETYMFGEVADDGRLLSLVETVNQIKD